MDLNEHVGRNKAEAPAFGAPLMAFEEDPEEEYIRRVGGRPTGDEVFNAKYTLKQ